MANVNCPLCKGAVWIPAKKAEEISPDELVGVISSYSGPADGWASYIAAAILEKYRVERKK